MRSLHPHIGFYPTRYFGAKSRLLKHILPLIPPDTKTLFDPFGGSGIVGWTAKHNGMRVVTCDILRSSHLRHRMFIENNGTMLTEEDVHSLTSVKGTSGAFRRRYVDTLGDDNAQFLDDLTVNIAALDDPMKRDMATIIPCLTAILKLKFNCIRFTPYGGLTGGQHLVGVNMRTQFEEFALNRLPVLVFDNGQKNEAHWGDAMNLMGKVPCDCMYVDSPYICRAGLYESQNAMWDDWVRFLQGKEAEVVNSYDEKADLPPYTPFHTRESSRVGFCNIFARSKSVQTVIVSYNTTSGINPMEIAHLAKDFGRHVVVHRVPYRRPVTVKGKDDYTEEVLIVASTERQAVAKPVTIATARDDRTIMRKGTLSYESSRGVVP